MEPVEIVIGRGGESDHVLIRVLGRMHPGCTDFYDGNWLTTRIHARAGGFTADVGAGLRAEELRDFRVALTRLGAETEGSATLSSLENWLEVTVERHATGSVSVFATVADHPGMRNSLRFAIDGMNQADVSGLAAALVAAEERFPVLGQG